MAEGRVSRNRMAGNGNNFDNGNGEHDSMEVNHPAKAFPSKVNKSLITLVSPKVIVQPEFSSDDETAEDGPAAVVPSSKAKRGSRKPR